MIFAINSSYHIWLPFYMFNDHEHENPVFTFFVILEYLISVFCVLFTVKMCTIIWKIRVFHINMSILAIAYILQYLECFMGKSLITMHQIGLLHVAGVPHEKVYMHWWTNDEESIPVIASHEDILSLIIGGFLIWHYLFSIMGFIFAFCVERAIATVLSGNYEKHSRTYISTLILVTSHLITLYISWATINEHVDFVPTVVGCMTCVSISCILFIAILLVNLKIDKMQSSTGSQHFYTLAFRFQVKENIKALKLSYRIFTCISVYISINCIVLFAVSFNIFPPINEFLIHFMENCIHLNPLVICSVVGFSITPWKNALLAELPDSLKRWIKSSEAHRRNHLRTVVAATDTDIYFVQLQTAWVQKRRDVRPRAL